MFGESCNRQSQVCKNLTIYDAQRCLRRLYQNEEKLKRCRNKIEQRSAQHKQIIDFCEKISLNLGHFFVFSCFEPLFSKFYGFFSIPETWVRCNAMHCALQFCKTGDYSDGVIYVLFTRRRSDVLLQSGFIIKMRNLLSTLCTNIIIIIASDLSWGQS